MTRRPPRSGPPSSSSRRGRCRRRARWPRTRTRCPARRCAPSQRCFCSSVAPTRIGSLPRNVAKTAVARPMSMARHHLADPVRVEGAAVHPAVLGGDEDQLDAELLGVRHRTDDVLGTHVLMVEFELSLRCERVPDELVECVEHHRQRVGVETSAPDVSGGGVQRVGHPWVPFVSYPVVHRREG